MARFMSFSKREFEKIMKDNPQIGQTVYFQRNQPHVSDAHPYPHIDRFHLEYVGDGVFKIIDKDHLPL